MQYLLLLYEGITDCIETNWSRSLSTTEICTNIHMDIYLKRHAELSFATC